MATDSGIVTNLSPFGIPFKLEKFGIHLGDPWPLGRAVTSVYTGLLLVLTAATARGTRDRTQRAVYWMALLTLASLQSPFSPAYAAFALLWATTLLAARVKGRSGVAGIVGLWIVALAVPQGLSVAQLAVHSLFQTALVVGVCAGLVVRGRCKLSL